MQSRKLTDTLSYRRLIALAVGVRTLSVAVTLIVALSVAPSFYGVYGQLQAIGLVFAVVALLRYERVVFVAPSLDEALGATRAGMAAIAILAPVGAVATYAALPQLHNGSRPVLLVVWLAAVLAGRGFTVLAHSWLLRARRQGDLSKMIALQAVVQSAVQLWLLGAQFDPLVALLAGDAVGSAAAILRGHGLDRRVLRRSLSARGTLSVMRNWSALPIVNLPATLMSQALVSLPLLAWGRIASPDSTGHLALAMRIADVPMQLIAATATSLALTARLWGGDARGIDTRVKAAAYVGVVAAGFVMLIVASLCVRWLDLGGRVDLTASYLPMAAALAAAVALGAPHADLVALAGKERLAFVIHAVALAAGLLAFAMSSDASVMLSVFSAIILSRSVALWLALPRGSDR